MHVSRFYWPKVHPSVIYGDQVDTFTVAGTEKSKIIVFDPLKKIIDLKLNIIIIIRYCSMHMYSLTCMYVPIYKI